MALDGTLRQGVLVPFSIGLTGITVEKTVKSPRDRAAAISGAAGWGRVLQAVAGHCCIQCGGVGSVLRAERWLVL